MSRGVVLWPDESTTRSVARLWSELESAGISNLSTESHGRHRPHVSLVVGEGLDPAPALAILGQVPARPLALRGDSVGFFPNGTIFLNVVMTKELLEEHRRVLALLADVVVGPWLYYGPDRWIPHLTIGNGLSLTDLSLAAAIISAHLPVVRLLDGGGVEDGSTGERWLSATASPLPMVEALRLASQGPWSSGLSDR